MKIFILTLIFSSISFSDPIKVGVVDSGIDNTHPFFGKRKIILENFVKKQEADQDFDGHGTHVAGIISHRVSKNVILYSLKNLSSSSSTKHQFLPPVNHTSPEYEKIINFAIKNNIKILNFSQIKVWSSTLSVNEAFKRAEEAGILIVAASGNNRVNLDEVFVFSDKIPYRSENFYPCAYKYRNVICVGSLHKTNEFHTQYYINSNYGSYVDLWADGEDVNSSYLNHKYVHMSGSSMAAPQITALAANLLEESPNLSLIELKAKIFAKLKYIPSLTNFSTKALFLDNNPKTNYVLSNP